MTKIKQSPKLPPEKRREQLLKAARELFLRKGYRDTSTEEIARRAGVTKGALYYHFSSKEDIMFSLVKAMLAKHLCRFDSVLTQGGCPASALEQLLAESGGASEHGMRENIDFMVQAMRIPRIKKHMNREFRRAVERFVEGMDPRFGSPNELRNLAVFTFSLFHGLRIRRLLDPNIVDISAQVKLYEQMLKSTYVRPTVNKRKK